jgi:mono/diheme cytochrome c family protein
MAKTLLLVGALWLLLPGAPAGAEEVQDPGQALYLKYCGACHGPRGKGDGIAGSFMHPKPTDLSVLAKANGGEFPFQHTLEVIDGRRSVRAHGEPDMPVWGEVLSDRMSESHHRRGVVEGTLTLITGYIRSIQEK